SQWFSTGDLIRPGAYVDHIPYWKYVLEIPGVVNYDLDAQGPFPCPPTSLALPDQGVSFLKQAHVPNDRTWYLYKEGYTIRLTVESSVPYFVLRNISKVMNSILRPLMIFRRQGGVFGCSALFFSFPNYGIGGGYVFDYFNPANNPVYVQTQGGDLDETCSAGLSPQVLSASPEAFEANAKLVDGVLVSVPLAHELVFSNLVPATLEGKQMDYGVNPPVVTDTFMVDVLGIGNFGSVSPWGEISITEEI
ncbi:MAG: hypothetical protein C0407_16625, partial [Desulfobacca sp.]|nr:hypothetical protein [Desulfobacca sp.]